MKRKLLLCFASIAVISLSGCGTETKINNQEGNELVNDAYEKTSNQLQEAIKQDYLNFSLEASEGSSVSLFFNETPISFESASNAKLQANLNLTDIHSDKPTLADSEFLAEANYAFSISGDEEIDSTTNQNNIFALMNKIQYSYTKSITDGQENITKNKEEIDEATALELKENITELLSNLENGKFNNESIELTDEQAQALEKAKELLSVTKSFFTNKVTSNEYFDSIGEIFALDESTLNSLKTLTPILDVLQEVNPINYFEYTKVNNKKFTTLNINLNYIKWKNEFIKKYDEAIENSNAEFDELKTNVILKTFKDITMAILPTNIDMNSSLTIANNKYISNVSNEFTISGSFDVKNIFSNKFDFIDLDIKDSSTENNNYEISNYIKDLNTFGYEITSTDEFDLLINDNKIILDAIDENLFK